MSGYFINYNKVNHINAGLSVDINGTSYIKYYINLLSVNILYSSIYLEKIFMIKTIHLLY